MEIMKKRLGLRRPYEPPRTEVTAAEPCSFVCNSRPVGEAGWANYDQFVGGGAGNAWFENTFSGGGAAGSAKADGSFSGKASKSGDGGSAGKALLDISFSSPWDGL